MRSGVRQLLKEELKKVAYWEEQAQKHLMKFIRNKTDNEFHKAFEYLSTTQQAEPSVEAESDAEEEDLSHDYEEYAEEEYDDDEDLMN